MGRALPDCSIDARFAISSSYLSEEAVQRSLREIEPAVLDAVCACAPSELQEMLVLRIDLVHDPNAGALAVRGIAEPARVTERDPINGEVETRMVEPHQPAALDWLALHHCMKHRLAVVAIRPWHLGTCGDPAGAGGSYALPLLVRVEPLHERSSVPPRSR